MRMFSLHGSVCLVGLGVCGSALRGGPSIGSQNQTVFRSGNTIGKHPVRQLPPTGLYALVLRENPDQHLSVMRSVCAGGRASYRWRSEGSGRVRRKRLGGGECCPALWSYRDKLQRRA